MVASLGRPGNLGHSCVVTVVYEKALESDCLQPGGKS